MRAVRSQSILQLPGRPRLASLSTLEFLVLGLCELLGRLSLGLALGELLARRMPLSRLTLLELLEFLARGEFVAVRARGGLLEDLDFRGDKFEEFDEFAHRMPLSRLMLLELLELLALGEVVEYLSFDELLAGLSFGLGLDGLLGRLALGRGLGGLLGRLALGLGLDGLDELRGRLVLDLGLGGLDELLGHLGPQARLEFLESAQCLELQGEGLDRGRLRRARLGDLLRLDHFRLVHLGERVVVVLLEHQVDGDRVESLLSEYGAKDILAVAVVLKDSDDAAPDLRGRDELGQATPCAVALHAGAVHGPLFACLAHHILSKGGGIDGEMGVLLEPVAEGFAH